MRFTVDQTHIRALNQRIILDRIFKSEAVSRSELSRLLHISKSAMTENISALLEAGIVSEAGEGQSMPIGGRKPKLLKFNKRFGYLVAIDLNLEDPVFVLSNLRGEILHRNSFPVDKKTKYEKRLTMATEAIESLLQSQGVESDSLLMIAISTPGIYHPDTEQHIVNDQLRQFAEWKIPTLKKDLVGRFNSNILVANDVNAASIGELNYGIGRESQNLLMVSCGMGLGAGIIINGRLYQGSNHSAGEIASFRVNNSDEEALENQLHIPYLIRRFNSLAPAASREALKAIRSDDTEPSFKDLVQLWQSGDDFMRDCVEYIANSLGILIANSISLLNCDRVVFGGEYLVFASQALPIINAIVEKTSFCPAQVFVSKLGQDAGIYGLFAMSITQILDELCRTSL